jgi:hypothetical protein
MTNIRLYLGIVSSLTVLGVLSSCDSNNSSQPQAPQGNVSAISVSGQGTLADGTPIASKSVQYQLILDGANMFQAGVDGCLPTPAHVAGTVIETSDADANGNFAISVPIGSLQAAVVRQCSIQALQSSQIEGLTITASILADATTSPAYCSALGTPGATCVDDCTTGNRTLLASQSLSAQQVDAALQNGVIQVNENLSFTGLGPALTIGAGPDLQVDGNAAQTTAHVDQESFDANSCEVSEACVRAPGKRTVLRFDGTIQNTGDADLVVGDPTNSGLFTVSACHNVELLKNIMLYELIDPQTGLNVRADDQDVIGRKQGFCMMDITQINATAPEGQYNCENQGITRGWADVYDSALDCQFLDVTDVPAGDYILKLTVNPDALFQESNTTNNTVQVPITIPSAIPIGNTGS